MIIITLAVFLSFSLIIIILGMLLSDKEKVFTAKEKRNLFIAGILG